MFDLWARSLTSKKLMFQTLKTNLYKKAWLLTLGPGQATGKASDLSARLGKAPDLWARLPLDL